jgi:hypothetical protein
MKTWILLLLAAFAAQVSVADALDPHSAVREPGVSYEIYKSRAHSLAQSKVETAQGDAPVDRARTFKDRDALEIMSWPSRGELQSQFERVRDTRWIVDADHPSFLRRPSWMYPDDGCYARAAMANRMFAKWNQPVPNKIFAFGNLTVKTDNSAQGSVSWWYHVAPIVKVEGEAYVLDPSIEPERPLVLREWLNRMGQAPEQIEIAVCGSGSYSPYDQCQRDTDGEETSALQDQKRFLSAEWFRLEELRRRPLEELGDNPPWKR